MKVLTGQDGRVLALNDNYALIDGIYTIDGCNYGQNLIIEMETELTPTIGQMWNGTEFIDVTPVQPLPKLYTVKEFFDLFTIPEMLLWVEALDTPFASATDVQKNVKVFDKLMTRFDYIDVNNETTRQTLQYLAANNILPADKIADILYN